MARYIVILVLHANVKYLGFVWLSLNHMKKMHNLKIKNFLAVGCLKIYLKENLFSVKVS